MSGGQAWQQHRTLLGRYRRQLPADPSPPHPTSSYFVRFSFDDAAYSLLALLLVRIVGVERKLRDIGVGFQFDLVPLYLSVLLYINNNKEIFQDKLCYVLVIGIKSSSEML